MWVNCLTSVLGVSGPNQWLFPDGTESAGTVTSPVALASGAGAEGGRPSGLKQWLRTGGGSASSLGQDEGKSRALAEADP